ncbi:MAG: hypothetical protein DWQ42_21315 [Planctomycetota bacterium]|nr:MAG: hypothetical protein DWQ42_21315 [Planctomycetota bacterium]REK42396.1 MAG: hypothetical protein DWQ46_13465 [Planctomycetota bacterium]
MARKVVNRKELRAEAEAAEKTTKKKAKKATKKAVAKKAPAKRKSRAKAAPAEVRLKAFWGVFNQSLKRVALYEYSQRRQADKKAKDLTDKHGSPHFVQPVKEVIEEE